MSRTLLVRKIQEVLDASGRCDNGASIARDFATAVNQVNRRLDTSKTCLDQEQIGEAIRIAEERPPLFETCEIFLFNRLAMWQSMCQIKGWPQAEEIKSDVVTLLKEAFSTPAALEPLLELQRKAARTQDLRMAVRYLRRIIKLDTANKTWALTLASFEGRYLTELKDQFFPAVALKHTTTMWRIAEEVESDAWIVAVDPELLAGIADMRAAEYTLPLTGEVPEAADSDLDQTAFDEEVKRASPTTTPTPASTLTVTTTKIDGENRVEGWSPNARWLMIACSVLAGLLLLGLATLLWFGKEHYRKACEEIVTQNRQMLEERGGTEYTGIKNELKQGNYKDVYMPLREMVKREKSKMVLERRKAAEADSARKLAADVASERKKIEDAEAERVRVIAETRKIAEDEVAARKRLEEDTRKKAADAEAERQRIEVAEAARKKMEDLAAERKRIEEEDLKKAEAAIAERKRAEESERKKAEEIVSKRKQADEEDLLQNSGFESSLYMVVDLSAGLSATQYPIAYHKTEVDVPGGVMDEAYKTTKLLLRYVVSGSFTMGSPKDQLGHDETQPPTVMTVSNEFFIGVFEVTQKQWELIMGTTPSYFGNTAVSASRPVEQVSCYEIRENSVNNKHDPDANWPANHYVNEQSFMGKLRSKTGIRTFDLPTEIQWEYACRAGTTTALNSGKNITNMYIDQNVAEVGRYYSNGGRGYKKDGATQIMTAPVGSYKPNAWGLYDMHGNVSEWCLDSRCLYRMSEPKWKGTVSEQYCVLRGGGWDNVAWHCLVTSRNVNKPFQRNYNAGFRVLRNKSYSFSSTVSSR